MPIRYGFTAFDNPAQQDALERMLAKLEDALPHWVDKVHVYSCWPSGQTLKTPAEVDPMPEYKTINLRIYPLFFDRDDAAQLRVLQHELAHSIAGFLNDWLQSDVLPVVAENNPTLAKVFQQQYERLWECFTEEITCILWRRNDPDGIARRDLAQLPEEIAERVPS